MTRPAITPRMKLDCLFYRHNITCALCGERILPGDRIDFDHIHALTFDGPHAYDNLRPLHKECHKPKSARDVKDNAKLDRLTGKTKTGPKRKIRNGRKLPSRPFRQKARKG